MGINEPDRKGRGLWETNQIGEKKNLLKGSTLDSEILEDFFKYQAFPHVNS